MTIDEIKSKYGYIRRSSVIKRAKNLKVFDKLNSYDPVGVHDKVDLKTIKEKIDLGYTNVQLAKYFNCHVDTICRWRKKYNLPLNRKQRILEIDFTNEEFQVLYGTILGDGHIDRHKNHKGAFSHCIAQKAFAEYKQKYLSRISNPVVIKTIHDSRPNWPSTYDMCYCYIKCSTALNKLYPKVYSFNGIKYIDYDTLMQLDGLGLAVWYMDDGNNSKYGGYTIATMCFSDNDLNIIKKYFLDKWGIEITIRPSKNIYIPAKYVKRFNEIVYPHMEKSMLYKLKIKSL
jgi:hypothetical protein